VHWVITHEGVKRLDEVTDRVHAWNARKLQFTPRQVAIAADRLQAQGWLEQTA
jgi:hypothetical protein